MNDKEQVIQQEREKRGNRYVLTRIHQIYANSNIPWILSKLVIPPKSNWGLGSACNGPESAKMQKGRGESILSFLQLTVSVWEKLQCYAQEVNPIILPFKLLKAS